MSFAHYCSFLFLLPCLAITCPVVSCFALLGFAYFFLAGLAFMIFFLVCACMSAVLCAMHASLLVVIAIGFSLAVAAATAATAAAAAYSIL